MGIGTAVRHRLGRWEVPAAEFYRARFIDLDDLAGKVERLVRPKRILEIGCGDGAFAERLTARYPHAEYTGIDIASTAGRLYRGDPARAAFRTISSTDLLAEDPAPFDLVVIVDVVHHIPADLRPAVLADAARLTAPEGTLMVKDWERGHGLSHYLAFFADRFVSGDRTVSFPTPQELRALLASALPGFEVVATDRIRPRKNNILYALSRRPGQGLTA
jgi:2-polyprenyl-3-methyl-5-hydroxy-6-metoxy-1,4-benzoquinol methylase